MSSRLTKKSFVSFPACLVNSAVFGIAGIRTENTQTANQNRHLRGAELQQLRAIHQSFLWRHELRVAVVVAESVRGGFERSEGGSVGLFLRRIHAARCEGNVHVDARVFGGFLDRRTAAEDD